MTEKALQALGRIEEKHRELALMGSPSDYHTVLVLDDVLPKIRSALEQKSGEWRKKPTVTDSIRESREITQIHCLLMKLDSFLDWVSMDYGINVTNEEETVQRVRDYLERTQTGLHPPSDGDTHGS
jgi:hypothetical protein